MVRIPDVYTPSVNMQVGGQPEVQAGRVVPMQDPTGQMIAQMGQGVSALGEGIMRVENQIDNARTKEAEGLLADFAVESLTKYRAAAGKAAVDGYKDVSEGLEKRRREAEKLLQNDTQRTMFRIASDRRMRSYQQAMQSHYLEQVKVWDGAQNEARMRQFANEALLSRDAALMPISQDNPYMLAKGGMETAIRDQAALMQLPQSDDPASPYQQYRVGKLSEMHNSVLKTMLDSKQHAKAQAYLEQVQKNGELVGESLVKYQSAIKDATQNDEAFTQFQQWRAAGLNSAQMAQQLDQMLLDNKVSQEVYDRLSTRVGRFEDDERRQLQSNIRQTRQDVFDWYTKQQQAGAESVGLGVSLPAPIWEDMPLELRDRAVATGQDVELREFVNSGQGRQDTADGLRAFRAIKASPESLIEKDWAEVENAFWWQMSDSTLAKLSVLHAEVNKNYAVQKVKQQEQLAKADELKMTEANRMIDHFLDGKYGPIQKLGMSDEEAKVNDALRASMKVDLQDKARSTPTIQAFTTYLEGYGTELVQQQVHAKKFPVDQKRLRMLQEADVIGMPEAGQAVLPQIGDDGRPVLQPIREISATLMAPGKLTPMQVTVATSSQGRNVTLRELVNQFNAKQSPQDQIQSLPDVAHDVSFSGIMSYLEQRRMVASELLTDPAKQAAWVKFFGAAQAQTVFGGSIEQTARAPLAPSAAVAMYREFEQKKKVAEASIRAQRVQEVLLDFTASESRGGF